VKVTEEVDIFFFFFCQTKKIAGAIEIVDIVTAEGKCQTLKED
jgi:hypothetical protein